MFTLTSILQLRERGVHCELICHPESRLFLEAYNQGIILHEMKASGYFHPMKILRVASLLKAGGFNLVHTHATKDLWVLAPGMRLHNKYVPLLMTKHVGSFIKKKDRLHRWIYDRVDYALAISNVIRQNLLDTTPLPPEKILLLHNGINTNEFSAEKHDGAVFREELGIANDELLIGMLGRFSPGKGHEDFLRAAARLEKQRPNVRFVIVGEASRGEAAYEESVKRLAKELNIEKLTFAGFRSNVADVLAALDIFAFPSHNEAFGIALVEAMSMGKAVVCSTGDGILDIAVDNENALMFTTKDDEDLTGKLDKLINAPELRDRLGKNARRRAVEHFDLSIFTNNLIQIYQKALQ